MAQVFRPAKFKSHEELAAWFKKADPKAAKPAPKPAAPTNFKSDITEVHLTALAALGLSVFVGMTNWIDGIRTKNRINSVETDVYIKSIAQDQKLRSELEDLGREISELRNRMQRTDQGIVDSLGTLNKKIDAKPNAAPKSNTETIDSNTQRMLIEMYEDIRNRLQKLGNPELNGISKSAPESGSAIRRGLIQLFGDKDGFYNILNPERWM